MWVLRFRNIKQSGTSPVIIVGMHRSGTSLVTRILEKLGLFVGAKKDHNSEAIYFQKFNVWMMRQANASWDCPRNFALANDEFKDIMIKFAKIYLKSPSKIEYLGYKKFIKYRHIENLDIPWGWKDPRNTFTVEIWKEIFPAAKIIHVIRHPADVANSMKIRAEKNKAPLNLNIKNILKISFAKRMVGYTHSVRVLNVLEGMYLWKEYVEHIYALEKKYNWDILHIKYEELLETPKLLIKKLADYAGVMDNVNSERIMEIIKSIDISRKYAYRQNEEMINFYHEILKDNSIKMLVSFLNYES